MQLMMTIAKLRLVCVCVTVQNVVPVVYCCAVPDRPLIIDVISGTSFAIVSWQAASAPSVSANPGYMFYIKYRLSGDCFSTFHDAFSTFPFLLRLGSGAEYIDHSICLFVDEDISRSGPEAHDWSSAHFCMLPWPWLGPFLAVLQYVIYTVNRKKRGSTFVIITLEKHTRFL